VPPALPVVRVTGPGRNVGKTWVASGLIAELTRRGYRVVAIKRSHHPVAPDRAGSDSERFARAGAAAVLFCGADGTLGRSPVASLGDALHCYTGEADLAIVEGFKDDALGAVIRLAGDAMRRVRFESMDGQLILATVAGDIAGLATAVERQFALSAAGDEDLRTSIRRAAAAHGGHLCAGIVLGVRMARAGLAGIGLPAAAPRDALSVTVEVARCATEAIAAVTGCSAGKGNLRVIDYGKMAATFADARTGQAVRVLAREDARDPGERWAPPELARHHRQAIAYRLMPDHLLFTRRAVRIAGDAGRQQSRVRCAACGEATAAAVMPHAGFEARCRPCATGAVYYAPVVEDAVNERVRAIELPV